MIVSATGTISGEKRNTLLLLDTCQISVPSGRWFSTKGEISRERKKKLREREVVKEGDREH